MHGRAPYTSFRYHFEVVSNTGPGFSRGASQSGGYPNRLDIYEVSTGHGDQPEANSAPGTSCGPVVISTNDVREHGTEAKVYLMDWRATTIAIPRVEKQV